VPEWTELEGFFAQNSAQSDSAISFFNMFSPARFAASTRPSKPVVINSSHAWIDKLRSVGSPQIERSVDPRTVAGGPVFERKVIEAPGIKGSL
jgi:hypothetical protein